MILRKTPRAQQLHRRSAEKFLPVVAHSEPTIRQPRPPERRVIRFGVARRSFLPPHQVPLRHYCDVRLNSRVRAGSLPGDESIGVFAGRFPLKIHTQQVDVALGSFRPDFEGNSTLWVALEVERQFIPTLHHGIERNIARMGIPLANPLAVEAHDQRRARIVVDDERVLLRGWRTL